MDASPLGRLRPGDHVCWTHADDDEQRRVAAAHVRAGLRDHHKILWFTGPAGRDAALAGLAADGIDVAEHVTTGRLRVAAAAAAHLSRGHFDPERTCERWAAAMRQARREGYAGLRVLGDMSWAAGPVPGADRVGWFERRLNRLVADGFGMAICLYDRRRCPGDLLADVSRAHPATVTARGPEHEPRLRMARTPAVLRLTGEADLSNRDALAALLRHLIEDAGPVTIDLAGLRFADASACELIVDTGRTAGGRLRTTGARPQIHRLLTLVGAGLVPGLL
ncbi:MEDS domain-containing protein [Actinoplanes sp. RD1]|uniref:MEDS domain-containing protein n=1 Tax=Actinoplanes sp. RD1 TaxID=3064538 RepID=UPI0027417FBC|nr:MEDS domain-containing protein [Actinoplanes sp. RD1]